MCYRVLHVEDDLVHRIVVERALARFLPNDAILCQVSTLADALDSAYGECPDIVLLDLNLVDSTGLDTLSMMRAACGSVPIVVLTADIETGLPRRAARAGADAFLSKTDFAAVATVIPFLVEKYRMSREFLDIAKAAMSTLAQQTKMESAKAQIFLDDADSQISQVSQSRMDGIASGRCWV